jgi:hypothetical protein
VAGLIPEEGECNPVRTCIREDFPRERESINKL